MSYHSLSRAITTNPALSLVILSYHPSYNQDFSELWNHPTPLNLSFDNVIPYPVLSRQILPYHFLSLAITNLITKIFFRTLKSPHPFEFILWWRHSLSRAITQILPYHLLSLAITHLITKIFQNSKITPPLWIYLMTSFLIPCYHAKACLITCYP